MCDELAAAELAVEPVRPDMRVPGYYEVYSVTLLTWNSSCMAGGLSEPMEGQK